MEETHSNPRDYTNAVGERYVKETGNCTPIVLTKEYKQFYHANGDTMTNEEKSLIIDCIFANVPPSPSVVTLSRTNGERELLSGGSIIDAVTDFLNGKFRLEGMKLWTSLNGASVDDLQMEKVMRTFSRRTIPVCNLMRAKKMEEGGDDEFDSLMETINKAYSASEPPYNVLVNSMSVKVAHKNYIQQMKFRLGQFVTVTYEDRGHRTVAVSGTVVRLTSANVFIDSSEEYSAAITAVPLGKIRDVKAIGQ